MSNNLSYKKSFFLYLDSLEILEKMNNEQAGIFIKNIYFFQKNGVKNSSLDFGMEMALAPFFKQFLRESKKYNQICERNRINGLKGGRPRLSVLRNTRR